MKYRDGVVSMKLFYSDVSVSPMCFDCRSASKKMCVEVGKNPNVLKLGG
jgi:hypothetical protein